MPVSAFQPCHFRKETKYGSKSRGNQRKQLKSGSAYSSEERHFLTMDDGTLVVCSADRDIERPICGGIDVHKGISLFP